MAVIQRHWLVLLLFLSAWLVPIIPAFADGMYLPPITIERLPELPRQRAMLVYDNKAGSETLIVESTMSASEGNRFAWLLPLPGPPTSIEKADPGVLSTLEFCIAPMIKNMDEWLTHTFIVPIILIWLIYATAMISKRKFHLALMIGIFLGVMNLLGPRLAGLNNGLNFSSQANVLRQERVGNYNVAVLRGKDHTVIAKWLEEHKFAPLPPEASGIVDDYLKKGWVLLAADLVRQGSGPLNAHPLQVTFPSKEPVYPMRLTALGKTRTELRLFTFCRDGALTYPGLKLEWANKVKIDDASLFVKYDKYLRYRTRFSLNDIQNPTIQHPTLRTLTGPGKFWLCRLQQRLNPGQMKEDYVLKLNAEQKRYAATYYTRPGALIFSSGIGLIILGILLPVGGWKARTNMKGGWKFIRWATLGSLVISGCLYLCLPVKGNVNTRKFRDARIVEVSESNYWKLRNLKLANNETTSTLTQRVEGILKSDFRNIYTGDPLVRECSPGNYELMPENKFRPDGDPLEYGLVMYDFRCEPRYMMGWKIRK